MPQHLSLILGLIMAKVKLKSIKTNEQNPKDNIGRGGKVVMERHKGNVPKKPLKMKNLQKRSK